MVCSRDSVVAILLLIALLSMPALAGSEPVDVRHTYTADLGNGQGASIIWDSGSYLFEQNGVWRLLKEGDVLTPRGDEVIFLDVNDDGLKDIFIKVMEARVEDIYSLYISKLDDEKLRLEERPELFGSPYVDEKGLLISTSHSGPYSHVEKYKGAAGDFYRLESRDSVGFDMEKVVLYDQGNAVVSSSIKFLGSNTDVRGCVRFLTNVYGAPEIQAPVGYLNFDSIIQLKDVSSGAEWFYIHDQNSMLSGWIHRDHFDFDCEEAAG